MRCDGWNRERNEGWLSIDWLVGLAGRVGWVGGGAYQHRLPAYSTHDARGALRPTAGCGVGASAASSSAAAGVVPDGVSVSQRRLDVSVRLGLCDGCHALLCRGRAGGRGEHVAMISCGRRAAAGGPSSSRSPALGESACSTTELLCDCRLVCCCAQC